MTYCFYCFREKGIAVLVGKPSLVLRRHEYNVAIWEVANMMSWVNFIPIIGINRA